MKKILYLLLLLAGIVTLGYTVFFGLLMAAGLGSNWGGSAILPEGWAILLIMTFVGVVCVRGGWKGLMKPNSPLPDGHCKK